MLTETKQKPADPMSPCNRCRDFDEDCDGIENKFACWTYDPDKGWCPFLQPK